MSSQTPVQPIIAERREQMFPVLAPAEIDRIRHFGELRSYAAGEALQTLGQVSPGLSVILSGKVDILGRGPSGLELIVTHGPGEFMGELAQLAGKPVLVDARACETVQALVIPPTRLQSLLIAEAELGERVMRALILRRVGLLQQGAGGLVIVGPADSADVLRLQGFLHRNGHPYQSLDPCKDADARQLVERFKVDPGHLPMVLCAGGQILRNPTEMALARCIGLVGPVDPTRLFDVAVVGAGPAGLSTAVYAASEGLSVLLIDRRAFGGQAGASMRIENYLGFPTGITGMALMARAYTQAQKFGVETAIPAEVVGISGGDGAHGEPFALDLTEGQQARARSVVIASGARYRRLKVAHLESFEGSSVHYWASPLEANLCCGQEVALVGAGNSAGQAVVFLAGRTARVWMLVRGPDLEHTMSRYLIDRITSLPNVTVVTGATVTAIEGHDGVLQQVEWRQGSEGSMRRPIRHLFLFIGADPNTQWVASSGVQLDERGFVLTGAGHASRLLETGRQGVFAVGDVRAGSIKRVAAAVGEGAQVVAALHEYLTAARPVQATDDVMRGLERARPAAAGTHASL